MAERSQPYRCETCSSEGSYNGALRHRETDPVPVCRHHGEPREMTPVKENKRVR